MDSLSSLERGPASKILAAEAPGTVILEDSKSKLKHGNDGTLVLYPQPSEDPNDPLNWSHKRKIVNFSIAAFYVLMVFGMLDIGVVVFQDYNTLLGISYADLNNTFAANCVGLAFGCLVFIPFSIKYGRRPVYLVTTFALFLCAIWSAALRNYSNMIGVNLIDGLAGAVADTIVQMTINDLFFLHQRGTMNAVYLGFVNIGVYLAPVCAGYSAVSQGWPWIYWWCAIFLGVNFLLFVFFYEETKYVVNFGAIPVAESVPRQVTEASVVASEKHSGIPDAAVDQPSTEPQQSRTINHDIPMNSWRKRFALTTTTPGTLSEFLRHFYQPIMMLGIPAVLYVSLQYGACLSWVSVVATTESDAFSTDPYNFTTIGIGNLNLPPFIGAILAAFYSGPLSDWLIIRLAKRNGGVYEPEMRLYLTIFPALIGPLGLFIYGFSVAAGDHYIIPCVGVALYGFSQSSIQALSLTYLMDSYEEILGDALIGVAFVRNAIAAGIVFAVSPWIDNLGFHDCFVSIGCLSLFIMLLAVPMIIWGKKFRVMCKHRYAEYAKMQPNRGRVQGQKY
ncbi:MFS general substrate transporter-24 [Coleophoma cylindrospora]|uniref:MFS general substrate transporter-24 n=1 Tax=Coleophoma cylindrospora TaxID=1849047 RepID=A0A3D8S1Y7_9HELO|nr:MFS general substrate transporter-24 [Coleophoma cylindrospora]